MAMGAIFLAANCPLSCATDQDGAIHHLGGVLGYALLWISGSCNGYELRDDSK
jgi:hypothetical protein